jgi:hypothetical protein
MGKRKHLKLLKKAAQLFPTSEVPQKKRMTGAEVLKIDPTQTGPNGKPLAPAGIYLVNVKVSKNHYNELKRLFYSGGMPAVNEYMNSLADVSELAVIATADINQSMKQRQQSVIAGF